MNMPAIVWLVSMEERPHKSMVFKVGAAKNWIYVEAAESKNIFTSVVFTEQKMIQLYSFMGGVDVKWWQVAKEPSHKQVAKRLVDA